MGIGGREGGDLECTGRGQGGRLPDYLKPVRKGGPGPDVFIPWRNVLRLAGERAPDDDASSTLRVRYKRRIEALRAAGLVVQDGQGAAPGRQPPPRRQEKPRGPSLAGRWKRSSSEKLSTRSHLHRRAPAQSATPGHKCGMGGDGHDGRDRGDAGA